MKVLIELDLKVLKLAEEQALFKGWNRKQYLQNLLTKSIRQTEINLKAGDTKLLKEL